MQFSVRFYFDAAGSKPVAEFLADLRKQDKILYNLVIAGIKKLELSERHGPPFTELVDSTHDIFELHLGNKNIARVFFFFRRGQEIILTNGYVKKQQKVDRGELEKAQKYKKNWEERYP